MDGEPLAIHDPEETSGEKQQPERRSERTSCRITVRYRRVKAFGLYSDRDVYLEGMLRNRSEGGVKLETTQYIPPGQKVELGFKSPDGSKTYLTVVVVRWVKKVGERLFHVGVEFEERHEL